jgi:hypothetical protein|tara:strand:- start:493 stop:672 length:180 start_codon:yes stop_codon:yes gene_type:complete
MAYNIKFKKACYGNMKPSDIIADLKTHIERYESNKSAKKPYEDYDYKTDKVLLDHYLNM